jgi:hypothetical protein
MKKLKLINLLFAAMLITCCATVNAQEEAEEEKPDVPEKTVQLKYFNRFNQMQWLQVESQTKTGKKTEPRANASLRVYLDSIAETNLLGKLNTGSSSKGRVIIPPALKGSWDASGTHEFIVIEEATGKDEEETSYSLAIQKAKLAIDTSSDGETRTITVTATRLEDGEWVPAPDVEMKVGVERLGGVLSGGDEETYTTDSSGIVTLEFSRKDLPGNEKGVINLMARVDDNEYHGNLSVKMPVPWGVVTKADTGFFNQRTLWAKSSRAPYWLMFIAYGIIAGVWGTLIYLVFQLIRVIRMGKSVS